MPPPPAGFILDQPEAPPLPQEQGLGEAPPGTPGAVNAVPGATGAEIDPNAVGPAVDAAAQGVRKIVSPIARGFGPGGGQSKTMDEFTGRDPRVDYTTGTDYNDSVALFQAASPAEERLYLESRYGKGNVFQDQGGGFYVKTADGKLVAPGAAGVKHMVAWLQAEAPVMAGGAAGATAGFAAGGPPGAVAGAMIGGAAGQGVTEGYKMARGRQEATPEETAGRLGVTGLATGAGEGVGQSLAAAPSGFLNFWRKWLAGIKPGEPEFAGPSISGRKSPGIQAPDGPFERMTALTMQRGGIPPVSSFAPESKRLEFKQALGQRLSVDPAEKANIQAVDNSVREVLQSSGMPPAQAEMALAQIMDSTARMETASAGAPLKAKVVGDVKAMESNVAAIAKYADTQIDTQLRQLNALGRRAPVGDLAENVSGAIQTARADFSKAASKIYDEVERMTGGEALVPTTAIKREAASVIEALPKDETGNPIFADPKVLQSLKALSQMPEMTTFGEAQRIRSMLGDLSLSPDLTPGLPKREFRLLRDSVDVAFDDAAKSGSPEAVRMLRAADEFYRDGIRKFEDATINKLVAQTRAGMAPDPSVVAEQVLKLGFEKRAQEIRQIVGPQMWKEVGAVEWQNILKEATDPLTDEIAPRRLANAVNERGSLLDVTYGTKIANDIRLFSDRVAARNGKIAAADLKPDNFAQTMSRLEQAQTKLDTYMKENYLAALAKPGEMQDDAVRFIVKPGQETRLAQAIKYFGEGSPEVTAIRQQALKDLLASSVETTKTGVGRKVSGGGIEDALAQLTPKQQEMLFPDGLADDIRLLAKEVRFLFPQRAGDIAAGLAAGTIKNKNIVRYWYNAAMPLFWNWALSKPALVRTLALGLQEPGPKATATRETIKYMMRGAAQGMVPSQPEEPLPKSPEAP